MSKTNKWYRAARGTAIVGGVLALLVGGTYALLNSTAVQNRIMHAATKLLAEKLQTRVSINDVSVSLINQEIQLHGLYVEDRQQRPLLQAGTLAAHIKLWALLRDSVNISRARIDEVSAQLIKADDDSVPNYQFVLDAFKNKDSHEVEGKTMSLAINDILVTNFKANYNTDSVKLEKLSYRDNKDRGLELLARHLQVSWQHNNKKGITTHSSIAVENVKASPDGKLLCVDVDNLRFATDNHQPRKNAGKPHRGFFDADHLDITANMRWTIDHIKNDSVHATLSQCSATDSVSGIDLRDLQCTIAANKHEVTLTNVLVRQASTELRFAKALLQLPDNQHGTPLAYRTSTITAKPVLHDIARPFAPILKDFKTPLLLSVEVSGEDEQMNFANVVVTSPDRKLLIKASGNITGLRHNAEHLLKVHFDVHQMTALPGVTERIINQFPFRKFMMKQLNALGTVRYKGLFDVIWRHENFKGRLNTDVGAIDFDMAHDSDTKYLAGWINTDSLAMGRALDMPDLGYAAIKADFKFDISKERTAAMRRAKGGKLPIGQVKAHVNHASWKFVKVDNLDVTIDSDGAIAQGEVEAPGKFVDLGCTFSFNDTEQLQKIHITPKVSFHKARKNK